MSDKTVSIAPDSFAEVVEAKGLVKNTTPEALGEKFRGMDGKVVTYGDYVIVAARHFYAGIGDRYIAVIYKADYCGNMRPSTPVTRTYGFDGNLEFVDDGHAIRWAFNGPLAGK